MINYRSLTETLAKRGFIRTNTCTFDGKVYNDFTNLKRRETVSAIVDAITGAVEKVEVTMFKWDSQANRYATLKDTYTGLEKLIARLQ